MNAALLESDMSATVHGGASFDSILGLIHRGHAAQAIATLHETLTTARRHTSPQTWSRLVQLARQHPLREILHCDPFTYRCFSKPRGYAGDATALDYVLRGSRLTEQPSDAIAIVHRAMTQGALARALRFRRDYIAGVIDAAARAAQKPLRVFAAGCGHLRECDRIRAFEIGRIAELIAFDSDGENLDAVYRDYGNLPVTPRHGNTSDLVDSIEGLCDMDIVYCAGLMETLPQPAAERLARGLFAMVRPGGTLVVTNFLDDMPEAGYLEAYMDWQMHYRTNEQIFALTASLVADTRTWAYSESEQSTLGVIALQRKL
jgi:SAM-dependent methyltransferase